MTPYRDRLKKGEYTEAKAETKAATKKTTAPKRSTRQKKKT